MRIDRLYIVSITVQKVFVVCLLDGLFAKVCNIMCVAAACLYSSTAGYTQSLFIRPLFFLSLPLFPWAIDSPHTHLSLGIKL